MITDFMQDGNLYPAVGISFGLSTIYEILKKRSEFSDRSFVDIYIIPLNTEKESLLLADKLRKLNYRVDLEMNSRKLKKSFDFANKEKIPYVIVLGEDEIKENIIKIKNMQTGVETKIPNDQLSEIAKIID